MKVEIFGRKLITSGDLDPIYVGLHNLFPNKFNASAHEGNTLARWLVAYWCYYHAGFACYAAEQTEHGFWKVLETAAENVDPVPGLGVRWPRGSERRHFRGLQATSAVAELRERYFLAGGAIRMIQYLADDRHNGKLTIGMIFTRVKRHRGFGDWISFKAADMLDRCAGYPVEFDNACVFMFTDPVKGAHLALKQWGQIDVATPERCGNVVKRLEEEFADLKAPPSFDRPINVQEIETVLCKWKSYLNGHYPLGKDTREIAHGLTEWSKISPLAKRFHAEMTRLPYYNRAAV